MVIKDFPKISVIIPVYNVERFLRRCVDSIINQSYKNLEIVLVDDGSPDNSPSICDEYALHDKRIITLHKINGGLSSARNAALDSPLTGDYVTFVDSDDWIENDTYEYCIKQLTQHEADVIQFNYKKTKEYITGVSQERERVDIFIDNEILYYYLKAAYRTGSYSVCRCLFKRENIGDCRFREGKLNEDIDWKYKVLRKSKRMIVSNQIKYYYYQHGITISSGGLKRKDFDLYDSADELYKLAIQEDDLRILEMAKAKKCRTAFSLLCKIAYFGIGDNTINKCQIVKRLRMEHKENLDTLLMSPMPFSRKILAIMFAVNYDITEKLVHWVKTVKAPI